LVIKSKSVVLTKKTWYKGKKNINDSLPKAEKSNNFFLIKLLYYKMKVKQVFKIIKMKLKSYKNSFGDWDVWNKKWNDKKVRLIFTHGKNKQ
jgi:hypothetical protein